MSKEYNQTQIGEIVAKINELKLRYAEGAEEFNIPVRYIYRYNNEMKRENPAPHVANDGTATVAGTAEVETQATVCSVLPSEIQTIIVNYRQENPDHGYQRIEDYLRDRYFVKVSRKEIRKILKAHGLTKLLDSSFDKDQQPGKGTRRFEASQPGELYQMDLSYVYVSEHVVFYLILIIDDHSRFCVCYELVTDQKSLTIINALHRAIERYGKPQKLLAQ